MALGRVLGVLLGGVLSVGAIAPRAHARVSVEPASSTLAAPREAQGCGDAPLPACPLQAWMRREPAPALRQEDAPRLARAFVDIARFAPPGYPDWVTHATRGGDAARAGDVDGAREACDDCHTQYRDRYRAELRPRALP